MDRCAPVMVPFSRVAAPATAATATAAAATPRRRGRCAMTAGGDCDGAPVGSVHENFGVRRGVKCGGEAGVAGMTTARA